MKLNPKFMAEGFDLSYNENYFEDLRALANVSDSGLEKRQPVGYIISIYPLQ